MSTTGSAQAGVVPNAVKATLYREFSGKETPLTDAVLEISGGHEFQAASTVQGAGEVDFSGGTNTIEGTYNVTGTTRVSGGETTVDGTLIDLGETLTMTAGTLIRAGKRSRDRASGPYCSQRGAIANERIVHPPRCRQPGCDLSPPRGVAAARHARIACSCSSGRATRTCCAWA